MTAQQGAGIHSSAWRTSHVATFCGSSVALDWRTASMIASGCSMRERSARTRPFRRPAKSWRRAPRTIGFAGSGLVERGVTAYWGGGTLGHVVARLKPLSPSYLNKYITASGFERFSWSREFTPDVRSKVCSEDSVHDHARPDASAQGLAQVEPRPGGAGLHRLLYPQFS